MERRKQGGTGAPFGSTHKNAPDPSKCGAMSKTPKSPKTVIREVMKTEENQEKVKAIIESYLDRAAKGCLESQEFLIKQGLWMKESEDNEVSVVMPTFVVRAPKGADIDEPTKGLDDD